MARQSGTATSINRSGDPRGSHLPPHNPSAGPGMSEHDIYLFNEGTHYRLYNHLGAHMTERDGRPGVIFSVWAPNARAVSVVGDFNQWDTEANQMNPLASSGIWETFVPGLGRGSIYKYHIASRYNNYRVNKADPFGFHHETPPATGSRVWELGYTWGDTDWMQTRAEKQRLDRPISIYEVHAGSWMMSPEHGGRTHTYEELADLLPDYTSKRGFTHVEFLPIMEHPLYRSWGYQTTGYFAPTSRFGTPQGFMRLVDALHRAGVGVVLDWVPSHFPSDEHGPGYFDGTHLFEHADPRQGFHPDWKSLIFNYGRNEVRSFLISSALFWLDKYHADALRVDAVASMLYLDYSRKPGEWIHNPLGGNENLEAIDFLRRLNTEVYRSFPDAQTFAEESTSWPRVSRPVFDGGLGFGFKWDMGWMHDTLAHLARDPVHRSHHYNELTFRGMYMHSEHFTLPLSHDEVVHGKRSLLGKMAGDDWARFANLRLLLADQWAQPGKKLLFMGGEIGARLEWDEEREIEWALLRDPMHAGIQRLVDRLNLLYRSVPALHELDHSPEGFRWLEADDHAGGIIAWMRTGKDRNDPVICVMNTSGIRRDDAPIGVPFEGEWAEILNTDAGVYGGSNTGNMGGKASSPVPHRDQPHTLHLTVPALGAILLRRADRAETEPRSP